MKKVDGRTLLRLIEAVPPGPFEHGTLLNFLEIVVKVFPNLKNAWTYTSFSPSIKQGSAEHVAGFAKATEGK